ncbi:hypothetical protein NDU88_005125 [Pleurodeles waltl]|uniref:Uncharacterized protein n=1 Tax=Pleurodeles waltl TaxID=8319 RepID=A0AAV7TUR4_PLEWA|nr:hypothetical protein NDU88_005125 [Pleurodeles waltl]
MQGLYRCDKVIILAMWPLKWRLLDLSGGTKGYEVTALAFYTIVVGGRRPRRNPALINIGHYGSQEPMTMYAGGEGQLPPEEGYLACHPQGCLEPGGPPQTEHPLPEKMRGHSPLEQEDGGG